MYLYIINSTGAELNEFLICERVILNAHAVLDSKKKDFQRQLKNKHGFENAIFYLLSNFFCSYEKQYLDIPEK